MSLPPVVEQALTYTGAATATIVLLGLGVTIAAGIEGVIVSIRHRRRDTRWLGECGSFEDVIVAEFRRELDELPVVERRHG